ncbi:M23 family metallopeptidase [Streptomyces cinnamoneus]
MGAQGPGLQGPGPHGLGPQGPGAPSPGPQGPSPHGPGSQGPAAGRSWPLAPRPPVLRTWRPPPAPWAAGHRGVDLGAPPGSPVRAAASGTVSFAGTVAGRGVVAVELTGTGSPPLRTTYEPVRATVREGDRVAAGAVLGVLEAGPSHCGATTCLHWGLRRGDAYLDPLTLLPPWMLRRPPSRLLPLTNGHPGTAIGFGWGSGFTQ